MHDLILLAIALISAFSAWNSRRNSTKIQEIHLAMNSRLDELLEAKSTVSRAEGAEQERLEERARQEKGNISKT